MNIQSEFFEVELDFFVGYEHRKDVSAICKHGYCGGRGSGRGWGWGGEAPSDQDAKVGAEVECGEASEVKASQGIQNSNCTFLTCDFDGFKRINQNAALKDVVILVTMFTNLGMKKKGKGGWGNRFRSAGLCLLPRAGRRGSVSIKRNDRRLRLCVVAHAP